jgi:elongation factor P--(R)-beta-lysine ligase
MDRELIRNRSLLNQGIRNHFTAHGYLEVETPVLSPTLIPETSIENFETQFRSDFHPHRTCYLIPSPEIHMKQLIARGSGNIFQIARCFRNSEQIGPLHNPEFTMLEWYTMEADYIDSIAETEELFGSLAQPHTPEHMLPPFRRMSMAQAFWDTVGIDLEKVQSFPLIRTAAEKLGLTPTAMRTTWEDEFNRIFLTFIEPGLPQDHPLVLTDYPHQIRTLAKRKAGTPYRERWELYGGGVELANCYSEETDSTEVAAFFAQEYASLIEQRAASGGVIPDIDDSYHTIFDAAFPRCSGVALGVDRLFMAIHAIKTIQGVILFPFSDRILYRTERYES